MGRPLELAAAATARKDQRRRSLGAPKRNQAKEHGDAAPDGEDQEEQGAERDLHARRSYPRQRTALSATWVPRPARRDNSTRTVAVDCACSASRSARDPASRPVPHNRCRHPAAPAPRESAWSRPRRHHHTTCRPTRAPLWPWRSLSAARPLTPPPAPQAANAKHPIAAPTPPPRRRPRGLNAVPPVLARATQRRTRARTSSGRAVTPRSSARTRQRAVDTRTCLNSSASDTGEAPLGSARRRWPLCPREQTPPG